MLHIHCVNLDVKVPFCICEPFQPDPDWGIMPGVWVCSVNDESDRSIRLFRGSTREAALKSATDWVESEILKRHKLSK